MPQPPTRKVVKRKTPIGDYVTGRMNKGQLSDPMSSGGATIEGLLMGLMDLISPKTVPQDVELPNPGGWQDMDPRLKEMMLGFDPNGPIPGTNPRKR